MTHDEFIKRVIDNNPDVEILGQYTTTKARILCKCKTCGNEWMPREIVFFSDDERKNKYHRFAFSQYAEKAEKELVPQIENVLRQIQQ